MRVDAAWAFREYEAVRDALPRAPFPAFSDRVEHLTQLAERYDMFLLDAFGVLNIGETAIPGAVKFVAALRAAGKRAIVLSNSASVPSAVSHAKFQRLGFDFTEEEIVTSRDALKAALTDEPARQWGVMAAENSQIDELGVAAHPLGDEAKAYAAAEGFILLCSAGWTEERQARLVEAMGDPSRPVLVGNPDLVAPRETGLSLEPGWFAHDLARRTGCVPRFYGKPFGNVFEVAEARFGPFVAEKTVMVGDTLHTDVMGGAAAGLNSCLLRGYGLLAGEELVPLIAASGIVPNVIAERL